MHDDVDSGKARPARVAAVVDDEDAHSLDLDSRRGGQPLVRHLPGVAVPLDRRDRHPKSAQFVQDAGRAHVARVKDGVYSHERGLDPRVEVSVRVGDETEQRHP
jgi:hypothetical protein